MTIASRRLRLAAALVACQLSVAATPSHASAAAAQAAGQSSSPGVVTAPDVDEATLDVNERIAWREVRSRFLFVAASVNEGLRLVDELGWRLAQRGMLVNAHAAATAVTMQAFLEDAAACVRKHDFAGAQEALARAEYQRRALRATVGH